MGASEGNILDMRGKSKRRLEKIAVEMDGECSKRGKEEVRTHA
jgi:hypothetical protein